MPRLKPLRAIAIATIAVLAIIAVHHFAKRSPLPSAQHFESGSADETHLRQVFEGDPPFDGSLTQNAGDSLIIGGNNRALSPAHEYDPRMGKSLYDSLNTLYVTDDVDPLITGQAYEFRDNTRPVYANRTAIGGQWGLQEFAPDSSAGATGVDVGPYAFSEYEGSILGYNDGIPEQWAFPSTPFRRYTPQNTDHYGNDGIVVAHGDRLYSLWEPDHDPLIGAEEDPNSY